MSQKDSGGKGDADKDWWDKAEICGSLLTPLMVAALGSWIAIGQSNQLAATEVQSQALETLAADRDRLADFLGLIAQHRGDPKTLLVLLESAPRAVPDDFVSIVKPFLFERLDQSIDVRLKAIDLLAQDPIGRDELSAFHKGYDPNIATEDDQLVYAQAEFVLGEPSSRIFIRISVADDLVEALIGDKIIAQSSGRDTGWIEITGALSGKKDVIQFRLKNGIGVCGATTMIRAGAGLGGSTSFFDPNCPQNADILLEETTIETDENGQVSIVSKAGPT